MKALRILLVEDDFVICELLADLLADMGHSVCGVETTEAGAVNAAFLTSPDLMIVDSQLALGSGVSAVDTIVRTVAIPHIFVSGDARFVGRQNAIVLQKPYTRPEIVDAINQTMRAAANV